MADALIQMAQTVMETAQASPWAVLAVTIVYIGLSFLATPQFGLHAVTMLVFGPTLGLVYAWVATMAGAALHFWLGKRFGNRLLERYGGERSNRFSRKLARHGILASALIRLIPSGPFIMVNVAAGTSHMAIWKFLVGTGIGSLPKIVAIALVGGGVLDLVRSQDPYSLAMIGAGIILWVLVGLFVKTRFFAERAPVRDDQNAVAMK